ncbi:5-oxoprolinase subunit PxpB [Rhizobium halophilum]|uniref:5-oxoprolinase subunit PxpB n=1 Tax=Rhizobium halophilum TaxID=2846852 RepID=UPI001EFC8A13|nr:5-oxoprolinase subunit PxpB [Rhizobium halophilum]MCF6368061.1 5-oxoprolinase subunit PxpB [Rhizobium halophilum]
MRFLSVRENYVLVELADLEETLALYGALEEAPIAGIREVIPAARTLLIEFDPREVSVASLRPALASLGSGARKAPSAVVVEIPVRYDGEDLPEVASLLGLSKDEVIELHTESEYTVAFTGFAPGFAYLSGGNPRLAVPRRTSPRTSVPAGSVGLAGEFSGVYPKNSPGGWQLIGSTSLEMFDINREPAALLQPGYRVRFKRVTVAGRTSVAAAKVSSSPLREEQLIPAGEASIEVVSCALPAVFQDLGRAGQASQGISRSGAADRASLKAANRLVGNAAGAAALEVTLGGLVFRMRGRGEVALTGAAVPISIASASGKRFSAPFGKPIALDDGDVVTLGAPGSGMRSYLAVRGGFDVEPVLGSVAMDTLAQIGPLPLAAGDVIGICRARPGASVSTEELQSPALPAAGEEVTLDVILGPRTDWFTEEAVTSFLSQRWVVTGQTSRVGIRLQGKALERAVKDELPSEATVRGAIQVPASGQPVLFLADHPLTGGYPVIANVACHHLDLAGQIPVGARIRFNAVDGPFGSIHSGNHA